jgi:exodeoxyribonuclease V alpha subunit
METLKGVLLRTTYRSESFSTGVFRVIKDGHFAEEIKVIGALPIVDKEEVLETRGEWQTHPSFGKQFRVVDSWRDYPVTIEGLERYLSTYVAGIGTTRARAIIDKFETMDAVENVLNRDFSLLTQVKGINSNAAIRIHESWKQESQNRRLKVFLSGFDFTEAMQRRVIKHFGEHTQEVLMANPYQLTEVDGIGFKMADVGALKLGWSKCSKERTEAACLYVLKESLNEGHVFLHLEQLLTKAERITRGSQSDVEAAIADLLQRDAIETERLAGSLGEMPAVYLPGMLRKEKLLAKRIAELLAAPHASPMDRVEQHVLKLQARMHLDYSEKQKTAIAKAFCHRISIVNGGPGTGKTTAVRGIVQLADDFGLRYILAAPTGRAAKRLTEVTGKPATTIHRLLEFSGDGLSFSRNRSNPIEADLLVLDETSMNDLSLQYYVLEAVPDNCSVVMIGDVDQLPSVGPGMVLKDMIESQMIEVTTLDTVFRQAEGSLIIRNAHLIRSGIAPKFPPKGSVSNSYLLQVPKAPNEEGKKVDDIGWVKNTLVTLCRNHIPQKLQVNPIRDIQVLVPMKVRESGAHALNKVLQEALNPYGAPIDTGGYPSFRIGDRVMQLKNDYKTGLSNGDIGFIAKDDPEGGMITVEFQSDLVEIPYENTEHLQLAYAQTIHKSQGSEYPVVIIVMLMQHYTMLERNLLYTANTRAKQMCLYLASPGAIERAVSVSGVHQRNTFLAERIRSAANGSPL